MYAAPPGWGGSGGGGEEGIDTVESGNNGNGNTLVGVGDEVVLLRSEQEAQTEIESLVGADPGTLLPTIILDDQASMTGFSTIGSAGTPESIVGVGTLILDEVMEAPALNQMYQSRAAEMLLKDPNNPPPTITFSFAMAYTIVDGNVSSTALAIVDSPALDGKRVAMPIIKRIPGLTVRGGVITVITLGVLSIIGVTGESIAAAALGCPPMPAAAHAGMTKQECAAVVNARYAACICAVNARLAANMAAAIDLLITATIVCQVASVAGGPFAIALCLIAWAAIWAAIVIAHKQAEEERRECARNRENEMSWCVYLI
jgi:hypothetical protein